MPFGIFIMVPTNTGVVGSFKVTFGSHWNSKLCSRISIYNQLIYLSKPLKISTPQKELIL